MKGFVLSPRRVGAVTVIIGAATAADVWVVTYKAYRFWPGGPRLSQATLAALRASLAFSPSWTTPVAALIGVAAVGAAVFVLRHR